jgi:Uma2 family endonuclease
MITNIKQLDMDGSYTYADYLTWQFSEMVELIKGKIFRTSPAPMRYHQHIDARLSGIFYNAFFKSTCNFYSAPFDVRLIKKTKDNTKITTVVQPDFCIICDESKLDERGCIGAPDLIVEILSQSTAKKDFNEKYNLYEENKVKEYWIINPDAKVLHQYALDKKGVYQEIKIYTEKVKVKSPTFPKLKVNLINVFN